MEIVSLGLWIARLFGKTPSLAVARRLGLTVAIVGLIIVGAIMSVVAVRLYKQGVIEQHQQAVKAEQARAVLHADREANEAIAVQASQVAVENEALEDALAEAKAKSPVEAKREVGPVTKSYFDQLRKKK